jgi:DmsE family decaheme c-type cytochrome
MFFFRFRGFLCTVLLLAAVGIGMPLLATAADDGYAGAAKCAGCHAEISAAFAKNIHSHAGKWEAGFQGCESCHGPGEMHASSSDPKLIRNLRKLDAKNANATCLGCHEKGKLVHWAGSQHESRGLGCVDCHSIHGGNRHLLRAAEEKDVCSRCHLDINAQLLKSSHHPIREGKITCSDCHNPHGTIAPKLISANTINDKCYECHAEKRGPFLFEHKPVVEDCTNCHTAHGSNHDKLLVKKVPWICQTCHVGHGNRPYALTPGQTNPYQSLRLQGLYRACLNCHPNIHGSNHPSGTLFTR